MMETNAKTGWEIENRIHFDEIVVNYDNFRWDYPKALYEDVFTYSGLKNCKNALEIGTGTGKATKPFLEMGYNVIAIEIGKNMTEFISNKFKENKNFKVINASFENVNVDENCFDIVYSASAFHWVDSKIGCPKVFKILKKNGVFALFRNNARPFHNDELNKEILDVYKQYFKDYYDNSKNPKGRNTIEDFQKTSEINRGFGFDDLRIFGFTDIEMKLYNEEKNYMADEYIGLLDTMADHRRLPDIEKRELYSGIKDAINKHGGYYKIKNLFQLYMGRKK